MTAESPWLMEARKHAGRLVALGVLELVVGCLVLVAPLAGGLAVTVIVGLGLMVAGVFRIVAAFHSDSFGSGALAFLWGLLLAVAGFHIYTNPGLGLLTLTLVLAVVFFAAGLTQIIVAFKMKPHQGWGWMLLGGVVTVLLAIMVWRQFPWSGAYLVGTVVGINLLFNGIGTFMIGRTARKLTATD
jgi:uncharacterized membrane protein HdeD (DUF308 family)